MADLPSQKKHNGSRLRQYAAAIVVNIASVMNGTGIGWMSPVMPFLQSDKNPLAGSPMSDSTASWVGSAGSVGALVSAPVYAIVCRYCSRKIVGYVVGFFGLLSWSLILFAQSELMLLFGRAFLGVMGSGGTIVCSMYVAETVDDDIRGSLGTLVSVLISGGIVVSYILGSYLPYTSFNIICFVIPIVYLVSFWWMPESPVYLETKGQHIEAQKVRELLNMKHSYSSSDHSALENKKEVNSENKTFLSEVIHNRGTRRALIIGLGIMACNQLSGIMAVLSYTVTIFQESGSDLSPNVSTIIVGILQVVGGYIASCSVDRLGRKILLVASSIVTATCLGVLSIYFYLRDQELDVSSFGWVPLTALCVYVIAVSTGVGTISYIVLGEIFSPQVKSTAVILCFSMANLTAFFVLRYFISLNKALGLSGCYLLFSMCCLSSAAFSYFIVPETKNKSLETILKELNGECKSDKRAEKPTMV